MDISMTFSAFRGGTRKYQGFVAESAADLFVLAFQREFCCVVIKGINTGVEIPSFCTVTCTTSNFKRWTMGRFGLLLYKEECKQQYQK